MGFMLEISIIVPIYNVEQYMGESLDTLVSQSMDDIEIIQITFIRFDICSGNTVF